MLVVVVAGDCEKEQVAVGLAEGGRDTRVSV